MTRATMLRGMTNEQLAHFLSNLCMDPDWIDKLYQSICKSQCPIDGKKCLVHQQDDACPYSVTDIFLQWLKTDLE